MLLYWRKLKRAIPVLLSTALRIIVCASQDGLRWIFKFRTLVIGSKLTPYDAGRIQEKKKDAPKKILNNCANQLGNQLRQ